MNFLVAVIVHVSHVCHRMLQKQMWQRSYTEESAANDEASKEQENKMTENPKDVTDNPNGANEEAEEEVYR